MFDMGGNYLRLFLAVRPQGIVLDKIYNQMFQVRISSRNIKWVKRENLHITLKFFKDVVPDRIPSLIHCIERALENVEPFKLRFKEIGQFSSHSVLRVVFLTMANEKELTELAEKMEVVCAREGFEKSDKRFVAHMTLGRAKENAGFCPVDFPDMGGSLVNEVELIKSILTQEGPCYETIRTFNLNERSL